MFDWTNERIEILKELWNEGLTTSQIAKELGTTKNAVIGKTHRLNLVKRESPIKGAVDSTSIKEKEEEKQKQVKKKFHTVSKTNEVEEGSDYTEETCECHEHHTHKKKGKTLFELKYDECRWPVGDPKDEDFHFCGEKAVDGKPYCAKHCAFAYVKVSK